MALKKRIIKSDPSKSTYSMRDLDRALWTRFKTKCGDSGRGVKYVIVKLITGFVNGDLRID